MQETPEKKVQSLCWEDLKEGMQPFPVSLPAESMDRGLWQATVQEFAESDMTQQAGSGLLCLLDILHTLLFSGWDNTHRKTLK